MLIHLRRVKPGWYSWESPTGRTYSIKRVSFTGIAPESVWRLYYEGRLITESATLADVRDYIDDAYAEL